MHATRIRPRVAFFVVLFVLAVGALDRASDAQRLSARPDQIKLRAERASTGNGRVYRIVHRVSGGRGCTCTGVEKVGVPIRQAGAAVANARQFNSFR